jgi:two-component system, LytTR family, sensor kinase
LPPFLIKNLVARFVLHYLVWEFLYMLMGLPIVLGMPVRNWEYFFFTYGLIGSLNFLLFYATAFYLIPAFLIRKKRIVLLVIICCMAASLFTAIKYKLEVLRSDNAMAKVQAINTSKLPGKKVMPAVPMRPTVFSYYFRTYVWFSFIVIIIAFAYQLLLLWYRQEKVRKDLENQKLQAELSFLKLQINPHFLFNSLNNIYSMAILEKSSKTSDGIMKLSELIRYMLYEKEDERHRVSLDREIKHINSFIDLQKLRHDGDVYICFSIEGNTAGKKVPSLLLFPLIENSCKHGLLLNPDKPVRIQLKVSERHLDFSIHNFKNHFLKDETGGIGLANVRKRLELLYPAAHTLSIQESEKEFLVQLQLPL